MKITTVKSHLRTIYRQLRLRNRAQAVAFVLEQLVGRTSPPGLTVAPEDLGRAPAAPPRPPSTTTVHIIIKPIPGKAHA